MVKVWDVVLVIVAHALVDPLSARFRMVGPTGSVMMSVTVKAAFGTVVAVPIFVEVCTGNFESSNVSGWPRFSLVLVICFVRLQAGVRCRAVFDGVGGGSRVSVRCHT